MKRFNLILPAHKSINYIKDGRTYTHANAHTSSHYYTTERERIHVDARTRMYANTHTHSITKGG